MSEAAPRGVKSRTWRHLVSFINPNVDLLPHPARRAFADIAGRTRGQPTDQEWKYLLFMQAYIRRSIKAGKGVAR